MEIWTFEEERRPLGAGEKLKLAVPTGWPRWAMVKLVDWGRAEREPSTKSAGRSSKFFITMN
jgi:hypothetical protein